MNPRRKMGKSGIFRFTRRGSCAIISDGCGRGPLRPFRFATHNFIQNHFSVPAGLVRGVKGNQVQVLNDPVTVSGEIRRKIHCAHRHEKERHGSAIRKSGNLLKDAAHSFRRKRPAQTDRPRSLFCTVGGACFSEERRALLLCIDCRRAALRGPPTRPSLRLA